MMAYEGEEEEEAQKRLISEGGDSRLKKQKVTHDGESSSSSKGKSVLMEEETTQVVSGSAVKKIKMKTLDDCTFEVEEEVMLQSEIIKHMIEDGCAKDEIPLYDVYGEELDFVFVYCMKHCGIISEDEEEEVKKWDAEFIDGFDQSTLIGVIMASNYLCVKGLLDLACQKVADLIKGKTPEEIREYFDIENDFTPKEEIEIRSENIWAFD